MKQITINVPDEYDDHMRRAAAKPEEEIDDAKRKAFLVGLLMTYFDMSNEQALAEATLNCNR